MSETIAVAATMREDTGKGASRRLRRQGLVPGILYGGHEDPQMINVRHNEMIRHLKEEAFYSSLLDLELDGKTTKVVLKDLQRHPAKPILLHVDFQRVSMKEKLTMHIPLHFENEDTAVGVKAGGKITHNMTDLEVTCLPGNLPEFLSVDVGSMDIGDVLHVSDIALPAGVELVPGLDPEAQVITLHAGYADSDAATAGGEEAADGGEATEGAE